MEQKIDNAIKLLKEYLKYSTREPHRILMPEYEDAIKTLISHYEADSMDNIKSDISPIEKEENYFFKLGDVVRYQDNIYEVHDIITAASGRKLGIRPLNTTYVNDSDCSTVIFNPLLLTINDGK